MEVVIGKQLDVNECIMLKPQFHYCTFCNLMLVLLLPRSFIWLSDTTQRNAMQRNATQRNAMQRNATQHNTTLIIESEHIQNMHNRQNSDITNIDMLSRNVPALIRPTWLYKMTFIKVSTTHKDTYYGVPYRIEWMNEWKKIEWINE